MKDDSLSDVDQRYAGLIKACDDIDKRYDELFGSDQSKLGFGVKGPYCDVPKSDSVGKQEPDPLLAKHETALNVYAKQIWNEAIEAAAKCVDSEAKYDQAGYEFGPALKIRKLKK